MVDVQEVVLRLHNKLMKEEGIEGESSLDMEMRPRNGITSVAIVSLLLDIEEELGIELDDYLIQIRKSNTIGMFIDIVKEAYEKQHQ